MESLSVYYQVENQVKSNLLLEKENVKSLVSCAQCQKDIHVSYEVYLELNGFFYHQNCYNCKSCFKPFSFVPTVDGSCCLPIGDENGILYCTQHYISLLKCVLCSRNFDDKCEIYKLKASSSSEENGDFLAHVECIKCESCLVKIDVAGEYKLKRCDTRTSVNCKLCALEKRKNTQNANGRLSSRQKEILTKRIAVGKVNVHLIMDEKNAILANLADELKCSRKTLVVYLKKHSARFGALTSATTSKSNIDMMLDELKKMDNTLAPNKFPFCANQTRTAKVTGGANELNVLGDLTNSLIK